MLSVMEMTRSRTRSCSSGASFSKSLNNLAATVVTKISLPAVRTQTSHSLGLKAKSSSHSPCPSMFNSARRVTSNGLLSWPDAFLVAEPQEEFMMFGMTLMLRDIPHELDAAHRRRAEEQHRPVDPVAVEAMKAGLGL